MRMNRFTSILVVAALVAFGVGVAGAQCADPANSTFPAHVMLCPSGDAPITCTVLGPGGGTCPNYPVSLTFMGQAATSLWSDPSYGFPHDMTIIQQGTGTAIFNPPVGGCAESGFIQYHDPWTGVILGQTLLINSPDIDGSGSVNLSDVVLFAQAYGGPYDRCIDYNGDGINNLSDVALFASHMGH